MAHRLDHMTHDEVLAVINRGRGMVVLPVGATEQHGPHCPLGTNSFCGEVVASQVAEELDAPLAPTLPYGESTKHLSYPGTISLCPTTLALVMKELCLGLARSGFTFIIIVNGNSPNLPCILAGAREAQLVKRVAIAVASYWDSLRDGYLELLPDGSKSLRFREFNGHGGIMEASLSLLYAPEAVHMDRVVSGAVQRAELIGDPTLMYLTDFEDYTASGVLGDASGASVELGERIARAAGHAIAERARLL